jgi:broad specificity phosphatase PhoE
MEMDKTIVVVRHAHRDTTDRSADNGLSPKGHEQVKHLVERYKKGDLPKGSHFWTSPKLRCKETLKPLADAASLPLKIEDFLDEQKEGEASKDFSRRVGLLAEKLNSTSETTYISSHGDLIPELIQQITGYWVDLKKAQAVILGRKGERWVLL